MQRTLKFLLSQGEAKNLYPQFGMTASVYSNCVNVALPAIITNLINNKKARVLWDRRPEHLQKCAEQTSKFLELQNVVGMLDGKKFSTLNADDPLDQNSDYNGWSGGTFRGAVFLWDPFGKIIDAGINMPGSFHDSKASLDANIYKHIKDLPEPYCIVCDSAFQTGGKLEGKILKTDVENGQEGKSERDMALTHLRQCSEWSNQVLVGVFRHLKAKLETDNISRAQLLWACILLHNFRTETVQRNQIRTYFEKINCDEEVLMDSEQE